MRDILAELEKPGRDPRPEFRTAEFREGVNEVKDLEPDMRLQGVITNVTNFGAFVDIGVHQDGLVHISQIADHFVKDPHQVVKTGDVVSVRVLDVDVKRKRIALSMRSGDGDKPAEKAKSSGRKRGKRKTKSDKPRETDVTNNAFAEALAGLKKK